MGELSAFYYEAPISQYILAGKTGGQLDKLHILGQLIAKRFTEQMDALPQAIIPVPLHHSRLRQRGFNQSLELIKPLARALKIPVLHQNIYRTRNTSDQKKLRATERAANMQQAFSIKKPIPYRHIALFDDVITTGATCSVLKELLIHQGIERIDIWCCATTKQ